MMGHKLAKLLGLTLILVVAITATMAVIANEKDQNGSIDQPNQLIDQPNKMLPDPPDQVINSSHLHSYWPGLRKRNFHYNEAIANRSKDQDWLLQSEIFDRLSGAGKRAVLWKNGLLDLITKDGIAKENRSINVNARTKGAISSLNPLTSSLLAAGENIRVNDPAFDNLGHTHSESSIAVRGQNIIVSYNDASDNTSGYAISNDGGNTFTPNRLPLLPGGFNLGDGVVDYGPSGELYYATLAFTSSGKSIVGISRSTDNGQTFTMPVDASTSAGNTKDFQDKEWIDVDTNNNSPFKGNVYVSWTDFTNDGSFINIAQSTDGGSSYGAPVALSPKKDGTFFVQGSMPAVGPGGEVYVVYSDAHFNIQGGITIVKSTDGGKTFSKGRAIAAFKELSPITGGNSVRVNSFPSIVVDKNGNIHIVFAAVGTAKGDRADVFYIRSSDGGNTFSNPSRINDDATTTVQFLPSIAVASDGTLAVRWWDRRNDALNDSLTDVYMAISNNGGSSFGKNFRITDTNWSFGPTEGLASYHGDYDHIVADGNNFHISWSDERSAAPLTGTGNPDVYYAFVPISRSGNNADFNISTTKVFDSVTAGRAVSYDLLTRGDNGFSGNLTLSATPAINGLTYSFANSTVSAGQTAKLTIVTTADLPVGTYLIKVSATGGTLTRSTVFRLTVFDAGRIADSPVNASHSPGTANTNAGIKIDGEGRIHLSFEDDSTDFTGNLVYYTQSRDGGATYSRPLLISAENKVAINSALAVDTLGNIYIVWTELVLNGNKSMGTLMLSKSIDGGQTFSQPLALTPSSQIADTAAISIDKAGNILIVYEDFNFLETPISAVRSTDGGKTFSTPIKISQVGDVVASNAYVAHDSTGAAYVIYAEAGDAVSAIKVAIASDGQKFSTFRFASDARFNAFAPHLAIDKDDNILVTYYNREGSTPATFNREVVVSKSTDHGQNFSEPINISNNRGQSTFPFIIADAQGGINVGWEDTSDNEQSDILFARSTNGGNTFSPPVNLSFNPGISLGAAGAADPDGNIFINWNDDSTANMEVLVTPMMLVSPQPPIINTISPLIGAPDSLVTLTGANFKGTTAVVFAGNAVVPANSFNILANGTQLITKVPAGAQTGPISVITSVGTTSSTPFTVLEGDYLISATPVTQTISPGSAASFTIKAEQFGNFIDSINLTATISPTEITIAPSFATSVIAAGGSTTFTVNTLLSTPANSYTFTISGSSGQIVRTATVTVNVVMPDFAISFDSPTLNVTRKQQGQITVNIGRLAGFSGNIMLMAPDTKAIKVKLAPASINTTGNSASFNFKIKKTAAVGSQQLTFTGRDDSGRVRTGVLTLVIQ